jgi:Bacterial Ig-like domain (group 3)/FG-GAP-like repeat/FG-GAP repeat
LVKLVLPRLFAVVSGLCFSVCPLLHGSTPLFLVEPTLNLPANTLVVPSSSGPLVLSADFNADGLPDAVVFTATYSGTPPTTSTNLLLLLGNSGSAPTPSAISLPCAGLSAGEMAAADVNGDKKLDLVVSCQGTFLVTLLGNGDGTFQAPVVSTLPGYPGSFVLADFNGDGLPDAAYLSYPAFVIVPGLGNGQFGTPQTHALTGNFTYTGAGDFNGDGKQDLVFQGDGATYILGNGDGTFQTPVALPDDVGKFAIGDFNHDGYSDLAYSTAISTGPPAFASNLVILPGGSSGLAASGQTIATNGASTAQFLTAVDLTGSGNLDLVQINYSVETTNTFVFLGDGNGDFSLPVSYAAYAAVGVADLNGDGFPDLVGFATNASTVSYAPGNKDGSFGALPNTPNGQSAQPMAVGDLNGDGISDAVLNAQNGAPLVFLGRGDGRFTPVPDGSLPAAPVGTVPYPANFSVVADFNSDGNLDVASFFPGNVEFDLAAASVSLFLGGGDGTLTLKQQQTLNDGQIAAAIAGDFNSDKKQDLIYISTACWFLAGNGDGTFQAPVQISLLNSQPVAIFSADLNGDGIPDLVVADQSLGTVVYLGNGDGTFKPISRSFPLSTVVAIADVNQDNKPDLILIDESENPAQLEVYSGNGDGTFGATPAYSAADGHAPATVAVGDLNGDGLPDIVSGPGLNVFLNDGNNSFSQDPETYYAGTSASTTTPLALVRLNSNAPGAGSKQMLDALLYTSGGLTSLLNQLNPPPKPSPTVTIALPQGVNTVTTGATLTLSAALSVNASTAPTGSVTFFAGAQQLGVAAVNGGNATVTAPITGSGTVVIRAVYSGDANYGPSTGFASVSVTAPAATSTTLTASATSIDEQQQVTFTATVQGNTPTGSVTFLNGSMSIGTATISGNTATLTTSFATAGAVSLTANYGGDANNLASTSAPITVTVAAPGFAISVSPASATVTAGQSATFTIVVTPSGGFSSAVGLSCGALPSLANCSFATAAVTPANGQPAQIKLTITTTAASAAKLGHGSPSQPGEQPWVPAGGVLSLASLVGLLSGLRQHRRKNYFLALALLMLVPGLGVCLIGCGGSGHAAAATPGTPTGTATVAITGAVSGSKSTQTANLQLIVQ